MLHGVSWTFHGLLGGSGRRARRPLRSGCLSTAGPGSLHRERTVHDRPCRRRRRRDPERTEVGAVAAARAQLGGHLALHVAVSRPELLTGVVALDPVGAADDGGLGDFGEAFDGTRRARTAKPPGRTPCVAQTTRQPRQTIWSSWGSSGGMLRRSRALAGPVPSTRASPAASAGLWADLVTLMPTLAAGLGAVLPMTLIGCTGSPIPVQAVRRTADLAPHAEMEVLEGVGHFPGWSSPASSWPPWTAWLDVPTCRRDPHTTTLRCPP